MKRHLLSVSAALSFLFLGTGCVTGHRTLALPIQTLAAPTAPKGEIRIASVTDNRHFENKPSSPSTPSIKGDVNSLSTEQKGLMVGRQRNGYGKAIGDISLEPGDSVTKRVQLLVEQAFIHRGYRITNDPAATDSASVVIDEFWAWFSPGIWSVTFESRVYCTITLRTGDQSKTVVIKGYGINRGQVAKNTNWQLAYERAFEDFLGKAGPELERAGF